MVFKVINGGALRSSLDGSSVEFKRAIKSVEVQHLTESSIGALTGVEEGVEYPYTLPPINADLVFTADNPAAGHCVVETHNRPDSPVGGRKVRKLFVHPNFPSYLAAECIGIESDEQAMRVAAVYARSLEVVTGAFSLRMSRRSGDYGFNFTSTQKPLYWEDRFRAGSVSVPFRAAATIALHAAQIEEIDITKHAPYPPHIAGLMNPLPVVGHNYQQGFNRLSTVLSNYCKAKSVEQKTT